MRIDSRLNKIHHVLKNSGNNYLINFNDGTTTTSNRFDCINTVVNSTHNIENVTVKNGVAIDTFVKFINLLFTIDF